MDVKYALLSVYDKTGIVPFARELRNLGYTIISSGGTYRALREATIPATEVSSFTNFPEILGGRVKTLNPKIHGGILAKRGDSDHYKDMENNGILFIDVVAVNLYPFIETVADPNVSWDKAIENIDIGGPTMIRSAAKNHQYVSVLTSPEQYQGFVSAAKSETVDVKFRRNLAYEAFQHTSEYDRAITNWMYGELA